MMMKMTLSMQFLMMIMKVFVIMQKDVEMQTFVTLGIVIMLRIVKIQTKLMTR
jgi:hypothetical protein